MPPEYPLSEDWRDRQNRQDGLFLVTFWEIVLPTGDPLRYCSLADPHSEGVLEDSVAWNGEDWLASGIERGEQSLSRSGQQGTFTLQIPDDKGTAVAVLRQYRASGIDRIIVRAYTVAWDGRESVGNVFAEEYQVGNASASPPVTAVELGYPDLFAVKFPRYRYGAKCRSRYESRFTVGNACFYPSNEFGPNMQANYKPGGGEDIHERKHGWLTQQASRARVFDVDRTLGEALVLGVEAEYTAWRNAERFGPYLFRLLEGDFDVSTHCLMTDTARDDWIAGFLVQNEAAVAYSPDSEEQEEPIDPPLSSWLFCGLADASPQENLVRKTVSSVSAADVRYGAGYGRMRLERVGADFKFYGRATDSLAWDLLHTETVAELPSTVRLGLVVAADSRASGSRATAVFYYLRFASGGLPTCRRDYADCLEHKMASFYGGERELARRSR